MRQFALILILGLYLVGCIEHRPDDTTFIAEPKKEDAAKKQELKGLRVYSGTIPCADCPGIDQRLAMKGDSSGIYRLTEVYKQATEDGDEVLVSTGEWKHTQVKTPEGKKQIYYLSQGVLADSARIIRYLVFKDKIVQFDMEGQKIDNPALYTLKLTTKKD